MIPRRKKKKRWRKNDTTPHERQPAAAAEAGEQAKASTRGVKAPISLLHHIKGGFAGNGPPSLAGFHALGFDGSMSPGASAELDESRAVRLSRQRDLPDDTMGRRGPGGRNEVGSFMRRSGGDTSAVFGSCGPSGLRPHTLQGRHPSGAWHGRLQATRWYRYSPGETGRSAAPYRRHFTPRTIRPTSRLKTTLAASLRAWPMRFTDGLTVVTEGRRRYFPLTAIRDILINNPGER